MSTTTSGRGATSSNGSGPARRGAAPAAEALLSDAALGPGRRMLPGWPVVKTVGKLAARPTAPARRGLGLAAELGRIALGRSGLAPSQKDNRFADPAWEGNPAFRRLCQAYLAAGDALDGLISDARLDWRSEQRVRFAVENLLDALAPTNFVLTNPAVLKATLDTGGGNLVHGLRELMRDMARPPRIPRMVDASGYELGETIAVSPGAVVLRTPVFELIQYEPSTEQVREAPLLVVPPQINRFYVLDIAPGRSMVEHLVGEGEQVFVMSWRNPDERHAHFDMDTYAEAVIEALDAVETITGAERTHVFGQCSGGMTAAITAAHLTARGEGERLAGLTLGVTLIDNEVRDATAALLDRTTAAAALSDSARRGYVDGSSLASIFAFMRPNDLVWSYVVNNYLLGKEPPAFDVLFWNADATRLAAGLHRDFVEIAHRQRAGPAGRAHRARHAHRPGGDRMRHLRHGRHRRPPGALGVGVQDGPPARLQAALRALQQRPRRGDREPARQRQGELPRRPHAARGGRGLARRRPRAGRHLVGRLHDVARAPLRRGAARAEPARQRGAPPARRRAGRVRHLVDDRLDRLVAGSAGRVDKRRVILDAAIRVFAREGFHGCRVSDVADEAGVAYGLVYHYFGSKEEMLDTLFAERWQLLLDAIVAIDAGEEPPREKLYRVASFIIDSYRHEPDLMKVIIVEVTRAANSFGRAHLGVIDDAYALIAGIVEAGREEGYFKADISAQFAAMCFYGAIEQLLTAWIFDLMPREAEDYERAKGLVVETICGGLEAARADAPAVTG